MRVPQRLQGLSSRPIGIKRPIEVTQLHQQCTLIQPDESYLLLFGDANIGSGQQPSPAPPPLGRQSLLPGTTCSTIKPCRALPRSSLPCEPIHATSTMQTCSACARSSSEQPGTTGGSHAVFKTPWLGDLRVNIQNDHGKAKTYQVRQVLQAIEKLKEQ